MVSGSVRKTTIDGFPLTVLADSNFSEVGSKYENSSVPTSGNNINKKMRRPQDVESVVVACDLNIREFLEQKADQIDSFPMSYTRADGGVWRCSIGPAFQSSKNGNSFLSSAAEGRRPYSQTSNASAFRRACGWSTHLASPVGSMSASQPAR